MVFKKNYAVSDISAKEAGLSSSNEKSSAVNSSGPSAPHRNSSGMHWFTAAVFIIGDMMGGGMIALPIAVSNTGIVAGMILIVLGALFSGYTGIQLGDNWTMMQSRWKEYTDHCRRPYPEMAYRAMGPYAKTFVSICLVVTQFGICTVLVLLSSKNLSNFINTLFGAHIDFCLIILLVGLLVWPFVMLKSPMDFWQAAVASAVSSSVAAVMIVAGTVHDAPVCHPAVEYPAFSWKNLFLGYGTIVFAYGGHGAFPTIQHDMTKPYRFNRAVIGSYIFILVVYLTVSSGGFLVYGNSLLDTIIPSMQVSWMSQSVNIMITLHILPTIVIVFSPLAQQMEEWMSVSQAFGSGRLITRSLILLLSVFTALSVPNFGVFLDLVGGSTISLMTMVLPSVFFLFLSASYKKRQHLLELRHISSDSPDNEIATLKDVWTYTSGPLLSFNCISLLFGIIGGIAASTTAIMALTSSEMDAPCYVSWIKGGFHFNANTGGAVHCCGAYSNLTVSGRDPVDFCAVR